MPIRQNDNINVADRPVQQLSEMVLSGSDERDAIKYLDPILADMGYDEAERNEYYRQEREIIEHERNRPGVLTHALHGVQNSALGRTFRGQEATALPQDYRKDVPAFQQFVMGIAQFIPDAPLFALGGGAAGFGATEMMQKAADKRNTARWKRAREMRPDLHDSELERWMQSPQGMGALSGWEIAQSVRDEPDDLPDTLEGVKQLAGEILPIAAAGAKGVALDRVLKVAGGGAYKLGAKTMTAGERVAVETAEKAGAEAAARGASQNTRLYHAGQVEEAQRALSAKLSTISPALGAFKTAAEVVALPTASAAMEGRFPTGEEIIHNGMLVLGLNGMHMLPHVTRSMRQIFPRTGITPEELRRQIGENPNLLAEMMAGQHKELLEKGGKHLPRQIMAYMSDKKALERLRATDGFNGITLPGDWQGIGLKNAYDGKPVKVDPAADRSIPLDILDVVLAPEHALDTWIARDAFTPEQYARLQQLGLAVDGYVHAGALRGLVSYEVKNTGIRPERAALGGRTDRDPLRGEDFQRQLRASGMAVDADGVEWRIGREQNGNGYWLGRKGSDGGAQFFGRGLTFEEAADLARAFQEGGGGFFAWQDRWDARREKSARMSGAEKMPGSYRETPDGPLLDEQGRMVEKLTSPAPAGHPPQGGGQLPQSSATQTVEATPPPELRSGAPSERGPEPEIRAEQPGEPAPEELMMPEEWVRSSMTMGDPNDITDIVNRTMDRLEMAKDIIADLIEAGRDEKEAQAMGLIAAAHAEIAGPWFGMEPAEYLRTRRARYVGMTQDEFNRLGSSGLERLNSLAAETEDVAREDQIVLRDGLEGGAQARVLYQLNRGVDIDAFVPLTSIKRKYPTGSLKEKRKAISEGERKRIVAAFKEGVKNDDTGWKIGMSGNDFDEHLKSDLDNPFIADQYEAVAALPELMKRARLVESHSDTEHNRPEIKQMHRFYAPLQIGEDLYSVMLTVKEFHDGVLGLETVSSKKLYHHRIQKKMPSAQRGSTNQMAPEPQSESISGVTLRDLLRDVKDNEGNVFLTQKRGETAKGGYQPLEPQSIIGLFKNADTSTVIHETGHHWLEELRRAVDEGKAELPKEMWRKLQDAYKFDTLDDPEIWTNVHERFARDFEAYMREGRAPSWELQGVFAQFRNWLREIYRSVRALLGEEQLSEDVRWVFDRLLATEEDLARSPRKTMEAEREGVRRKTAEEPTPEDAALMEGRTGEERGPEEIPVDMRPAVEELPQSSSVTAPSEREPETSTSSAPSEHLPLEGKAEAVAGREVDLNDRAQVAAALDRLNNENVPTVNVERTPELAGVEKSSPQSWLRFAIDKVRSLQGKKLKDPLGEEVYLTPGSTETLEEYALHLLAGAGKPLEEAKLSRAYGVYLLDKTVQEPMVILLQKPKEGQTEGRKVYLSLYDLPGKLSGSVIVGVEEGQKGRVITTFVSGGKSGNKGKALQDFKSTVKKADRVLYEDGCLSGHPRQPPALDGTSTGDATLHAGRTSILRESRGDVKPEGEGQPDVLMRDMGGGQMERREANRPPQDTDVLYAQGGGSAPAPQGGQGQPQPLPTDFRVEDVVRLENIAADFSQVLNVPIRLGRMGRVKKSVLGVFRVKQNVIRVRKMQDVATVAHEYGHALQKALFERVDPADLAPWANELTPLATPGNPVEEGFAEFVSLFVTDKAKAQQVAPTFYTAFTDMLNKKRPDVMGALLQARDTLEAWKQQPAAAQVASHISFGSEGQESLASRLRRKEGWEDLYTRVVNKLYGLRWAEKQIVGEAKLKPEESPYLLARLYNGVQGKVDHFLHKGTFSFKDHTINGESLGKIIGEVDNQALFATYLVARRGVKLAEDRGIETGIDLGIMREVYDSGKARYEALAQRLGDYQDRVLQFLVEGDVIDQQSASRMRALNENYVPFQRLMVEEAGKEAEAEARSGVRGGGDNLRPSNPIHAIRGSSRMIINPLESIVANTAVLIEAAEKNKIARSLIDLAGKYEDTGWLVEKIDPKMVKTDLNADVQRKLLDVAQTADPATKDAIEKLVNTGGLDGMFSFFQASKAIDKASEMVVFIDGKPQIYKVDRRIAEVMNNLTPESLPMVVRMLGFFSRALRIGVTLDWDFMVRNFLRDSSNSFVLSRSGFKPFLDTWKGLVSAWKKDEDYWAWMRGGGSNTHLLQRNRQSAQSILEGMQELGFMERAWNVVRNPREWLRVLTAPLERGSELSEYMTRLGEFKKAREKARKAGMSELNAEEQGAYEARDLQDFALHGSDMRSMLALTAFQGAQIQGLDRGIRGFRADPKGFLLRAAILSAGSIAVAFLTHDDEEVMQLDDGQRDMFWCVSSNTWRRHTGQEKTDDYIIWRFPKPFEIGVLFASLPERLTHIAIDMYREKMKKQKGEAWAETPEEQIRSVLRSFWDVSLPNVVPTFSSPIIDNRTNVKTAFGSPIVPKRMEGLLPEYQYGPWTSPAMKKLSHGVGNLLGREYTFSPAKAENLINGYGGGWGRRLLSLVDCAVEYSGRVESPPEIARGIERWPIVHAITYSHPGANARDIRRFYDMWGDVERGLKTLGYLRRNSAEGENEKELADLEREFEPYADVRKSATALGNILTAMRLVRSENRLSDKQRETLWNATVEAYGAPGTTKEKVDRLIGLSQNTNPKIPVKPKSKRFSQEPMSITLTPVERRDLLELLYKAALQVSREGIIRIRDCEKAMKVLEQEQKRTQAAGRNAGRAPAAGIQPPGQPGQMPANRAGL